MKKLIALFFALVCVLALVGCSTTEHENNSNTTKARIADAKDNISTEVTEYMSEISDETTCIVEIRDRTECEPLECAEAEELFYEDDTTLYWFNVIKSHYIIVTYSNGNSEDIVTALNADRATIADLDKFGIEYKNRVKEVSQFQLVELNSTYRLMGQG